MKNNGSGIWGFEKVAGDQFMHLFLLLITGGIGELKYSPSFLPTKTLV